MVWSNCKHALYHMNAFTQTHSLDSGLSASYLHSSSQWRSMWECVASHHLGFAHHNGGVRVKALTFVLTALYSFSTPPLTEEVAPATPPPPPGKASSRWKTCSPRAIASRRFIQTPPPISLCTPTHTHTVAHSALHTQTRALRNYHLKDVMMWLGV